MMTMDGIEVSSMDGFFDDLLKTAQTSLNTGLQATKDAAIATVVQQPTVQQSVQRATELAVAKAEQQAVLTAYNKSKEIAAKYKWWLVAGGAVSVVTLGYLIFRKRR